MRRKIRGVGLVLAIGLISVTATTAGAQETSDDVGVDPCTTPATNVRGDIIWGHESPDTRTSQDELGRHVRDFVFISEMKVDDDRLGGTTTATIDWDFYKAVPAAKGRAGINRGTFRIENGDGAWEGPWTGIGSATDSWRAIVQLLGSGAYEGLSATLFTRSDVTGPIKGTVYPTDLASCDFAIDG